jgi:hypothetical protein
MKQYKVTACYTVYCYATVEAENEDDAYTLAQKWTAAILRWKMTMV